MTVTRRSLALIVALPLLVCIAWCAGCVRSAPAAPPAPAPAPQPPPPPREPATLLFLGDINMGRTLGRMLQAGRTDYPFASIGPLIREADFACAEFEVQVTDRTGTVGQPGSLVYCAPAVAADVMKDAGFDAVWSANNHIWDYGKDALLDTIVNLERVEMPFTGIGRDVDEAFQPAIVEVEGWRIATFSVTSIFNSEFVGEPTEHIAWADPERLARAIAEVRDDVDYIAVNHHGGAEQLAVPEREKAALNRAMIEAGADIVIGGHPHVFQGGEWHKGKPIFHSVGNLVYVQSHPWASEGLGVRVTLREEATPEVEILAMRAHYQPVRVEGPDLARYRERFRAISAGFDHPIEWLEDGAAGGRPEESDTSEGDS